MSERARGIWHAAQACVQRAGGALACLALVAMLGAAAAQAAEPETTSEDGATEATSEGGAPEATVATELERLVETIETPESRERLLSELRALLAASKTDEAEEEPEGASALQGISDGLALVGDQLVTLAREIADIPDVADWLGGQWDEAGGRSAWLTSLWKIAAVIGSAIVVALVAFYLLRRPRRRVEAVQAPKRWLRPLLLAAYNLLRFGPHLIFVGVGYGIITVIDPSETARLITLAFINAHLIASAVRIAANMAFAPHTPQLRLNKITDVTAMYCVIWWRRLVNITVYGYFACQAILLLGLPESGYSALVRILGIVVVGLLIALILQNRISFAKWMRETAQEGRSRLHLRVFAILGRAADFWHIPAIIYVVAGGMLAAAEGIEGFLFLVKSTAATAAIAWIAGLVSGGLRHLFERGFRLRAETQERYPGLQARVNRYLPLVRRILQGIVFVIAVILIFEAWEADAFGWLASDTGQDVIGTIASILAIVVIALLVLEIVTTLIDRYLTTADADGHLVERSQRARTLLPLARNALRVIVGIIAALMVLSEIGIDIAPVLAGVGVVGLAIGFGAQTLVKDIITGLFILLEDSVAVGDVVNAGGLSGVVEVVTIRTIRLRDLSGNVHTIPFSAVDTVTNMTKDFSYYLIEAGVAYREDYEEVVAVMRQVGEELQDDPDYGPNMLEPLEIMGLHSFADSAVVIRARIKTIPSKQWATGREYNRRMKAAFDAHGIEIPFPHSTIYFGEDKQGRAPVAHLLLDQQRLVEAAEGVEETPEKDVEKAPEIEKTPEKEASPTVERPAAPAPSAETPKRSDRRPKAAGDSDSGEAPDM